MAKNTDLEPWWTIATNIIERTRTTLCLHAGPANQSGTAGGQKAVGKRAPTAYFLFANAHRDSAKQELLNNGHGPKVSVAQVG